MNRPLRIASNVPTAAANVPARSDLLQRKCACGNRTSGGALCKDCGHPLQAKLSIGASSDPLEHEADRVANAVVFGQPSSINVSSMPAAVVQHDDARVQRTNEEKYHALQRKPATTLANSSPSDAAPPSVHDVLRSSGRPLDVPTRGFMELRFGRDFSGVRVHTDAAAGRSAREVNANAYTIGRDVVFGAGRFEPNTPAGRHLIAHELTHVVQQSSAPMLHRRTEIASEGPLVPIHRSATERIARDEQDAPSVGSAVGYVAVYLGADDSDEAYIDFHTRDGLFRYRLEEYGSLKPGEYQATVTVKGNDVNFSFAVKAAELFDFSYRIEAGQPNPKTFFSHQTSVTFTVTAEQAPPLRPKESGDKTAKEKEKETDPNAVYVTPEEAMRLCESGNMPGVKVFPFRGTRFGGAPITVFRDGSDIVAKSYVYVLGDKDFRAQTRTLPVRTFIGGVRLKPNEIVRVHTYEPRWYHLNITGSTSGDIEDEFCVTGEQMLRIGEMSDAAVKWNAVLTVIDAVTLIVPVGKLASFVAKPVLRSGTGVAAAIMLGLREAAPTALAGIGSRATTMIVEEQAVNQVASRAISQSTSHAVIEFSQRAISQAATRGVGEAAGDVGAGVAKQAFARTVTVTVIDAAGAKLVSTVTTPTGDAALDAAIDSAFAPTAAVSGTQIGSAAAGQGVVSVAPEIAAGFTQAQVVAFRRLLGKTFSHNDIAILEQVWNAAARPGDAAMLTAANSRYLFDLQRNRFWTRVAANPQARALFTDAGCEFSGGAPYYMLNGRRIVMTIDHVFERQTRPSLALTGSNLRMAFSRENSVVLRLLTQLDPFQRPPGL